MEDFDPVIVKRYEDMCKELIKIGEKTNMFITPENVFQPAVLKGREIFRQFSDSVIKPDSTIEGKENLLEFYENFKKGQSSLILSEHKSNFDVPTIFTMLYRQEQVFKDIFDKIVFVAGRKLNEQEYVVKLLSEIYNRVIVVPKLETQDADDEEVTKILKINMATQKFIKENKQNYILLVFPTGTRSKPWDRSTYRGVREVFNYIKGHDQIIFLSMNGNCMVPRKALMSKEPPREDTIRMFFSKVHKSQDFIEAQKQLWEKTDKSEDYKQFVIDRVMDQIYQQKGIMPWDEKY